jgi:integrase
MNELNYNDYGYDITHIDALANQNFLFDCNMPVSKKSKFGDGIWDWTDEHNLRLKLADTSKISFNWDSVTEEKQNPKDLKQYHHQHFVPVVPYKIVEDVKRAIFVYAFFPNIYTSSFRGKPRARGVKAITVVRKIRAVINFFSHIYLQAKKPDGTSRIRAVSDITLKDIKWAITNYPYELDDVKHVLTLFTLDYIVSNLMYGMPKWNSVDIKNLSWNVKIHDNIKPLPNELFKILSINSTKLVVEFLLMLNGKVKDKGALLLIKGRENKWSRFNEMFESYIKRREIIRIKGRGWVSDHTKSFKKEFGVKPKEISDFLYNVQIAAQVIILLYTGMRYSEAISLQTGCLFERDGVILIKSTVMKNRDSSLPSDCDEWIAIDILQDAILALEYIAQFTFNKYLFSNFETVRLQGRQQPIMNKGLIDRLNTYLKKIDINQQWTEWVLSPHQFRHGLIWQLARAEVGIPYITRQLHHFYTKISEYSFKVNQTTMVYGLQKERLVGNAVGFNALQSAKYEVLKDLYGEGRRFAGGGAALHVEKTEAFFKGIGLAGRDRNEYILKLTNTGIMPVRTGLGWCTRNHTNPPPEEETPPCIGDLNCNPHICKHSVVPESRKEELIRNYIDATQKIKQTEYSHLKKYWEQVRNSFASMLQKLGVNTESVILNSQQ